MIGVYWVVVTVDETWVMVETNVDVEVELETDVKVEV